MKKEIFAFVEKEIKLVKLNKEINDAFEDGRLAL